MHGADKFQNGPVRFAVESTRDGKEILLKHRLRTKRNHKYSKREDFGWDEAAGQRVLMCANRLVKQLPALPVVAPSGKSGHLELSIRIWHSHISGDVFCASRRGTDNVTRFSPKVSCCHADVESI
jgi:hypothetical protein